MMRSDPLVGVAAVPGDKSISHRAVLLSALARGRSVVSGCNLGADVLSTCGLVRALGGACVLDQANHRVEIEGRGWSGLREPPDVVDAGNSGTTLRIGLGVLAGLEGGCAITGDASLRRRPMLRVTRPLRALGARIDGRDGGNLPPLWVRGGHLRGAEVTIDVPSAQVKSAVLLAGLRAEGSTSLRAPAPSRDHTERMLEAAGVAVERSGATLRVRGGQEPAAVDRRVPGDVSAAMFLVVAALLVEGSDLEIRDVGLNPTRTAALDVLVAMGADLEVEPAGEWGGEPVGHLRARASELAGVEIVPEIVPYLIDEIPALAVAATQAHGPTVIAGAAELRVKESDRIEGLASGLGALGARIEPRSDGFVVWGPSPLGSGRVGARGDHRIALALSVASLVAEGPVEIEGLEAAGVSFPEWAAVLGRARGNGS